MKTYSFFERRITMTTIYFDRTHVRSAAPDLYGLFFEDINRSSDSGLYPEMIETDPLRTVFRLLKQRLLRMARIL